jgi:hypothetical protein
VRAVVAWRLIFLGAPALRVEDLLELLGQTGAHTRPRSGSGVVVAPLLPRCLRWWERQLVAVVVFVHHMSFDPSSRGAPRQAPRAAAGARRRGRR